MCDSMVSICQRLLTDDVVFPAKTRDDHRDKCVGSTLLRSKWNFGLKISTFKTNIKIQKINGKIVEENLRTYRLSLQRVNMVSMYTYIVVGVTTRSKKLKYGSIRGI